MPSLPKEANLPLSILEWVIQAVHPEAKVLSVRPLQGGISSLVYSLSLAVLGEERSVVLRLFHDGEWVRNQPDLARREAEGLRMAARIGDVQTPRLIAYDGDGSQCGTKTPALLMTRLEGGVVLQPADVSRWLDGMAQALARIHRMKLEPELSGGSPTSYPWTYAPYSDASSMDTSSWSGIPGRWKEAADLVARSRPTFRPLFIHRDYHPANVLWSGSEVSGVVDWVNGCIGPAGIDVGHCRVNLAQLHDIRTADEFLDRYRHYAGDSFAYDPYWDLVTLLDFAYWPPDVYAGWTALGVTGLTREMIIERLDAYLISLLERSNI